MLTGARRIRNEKRKKYQHMEGYGLKSKRVQWNEGRNVQKMGVDETGNG